LEVAALNVAVTAVGAVTVTLHAPVPAQAPLQPAKVEPAAGVAVRVTAVPGENVCEQLAPQLMPAGALVTVPDPDPLLVTDRVGTVVPVADPVTAREIVSPLAEKVTLLAKVPAVLGAKRTVTV